MLIRSATISQRRTSDRPVAPQVRIPGLPINVYAVVTTEDVILLDDVVAYASLNPTGTVSDMLGDLKDG